MIGGRGADRFVLSDDFASSARAAIVDFGNGADLIEIDADDFGGGLVAGPLDADAFLANTTGRAEDAEDRFIYETDSGKLFYDADGNGAGGSMLIARLAGAPALDADDFLIVDGGELAVAPLAAARTGEAPVDRTFGEDTAELIAARDIVRSEMESHGLAVIA